MLFNTPQFVLTLTVFLIVWFLLPEKWKKPVLLLCSYAYAWLLGGSWTVITLVCVTLVTYIFGNLLPFSRHKKLAVFCFIFSLTLLLFYVKYTPSLTYFLQNKLGAADFSINVVSMIGVSYYVFSSISYIIDIYRGNDVPDKNILDTAIWIALFTKIISGPIERHRHFKEQLNQLAKSKFDMERFKRGLLICSLGYFYKIVIADRINLFTGSVYYNLYDQEGFTLIITMFLYSLQIYFDFAGYSLIAFGISFVLDLKITKNFNHPYFSGSITEFWKRWHMSLSTWLRDYIYIPLGGSRKGKIRQYINIMLTFLISAIWHGSGVTFLIWGAMHGIMQIAEKEFGTRVKLPEFIRKCTTFIYVSIAWVFFRAESLEKAKRFLKYMFRWNPEVLTDGTLTCFTLDFPDWIVLLIALAIAFMLEVLQYNDIGLYKSLQRRNIIIRWFIYFLIVLILLIFGKYGPSYTYGSFIYFQF